MINKIENGHSTGSIRTLSKLAAALGVRIDELIGEQSPEQRAFIGSIHSGTIATSRKQQLFCLPGVIVSVCQE